MNVHKNIRDYYKLVSLLSVSRHIFKLTIVTSSEKHVRTSGLGNSVAHTFVALETKIHVYDANTRH